MNMTKRSIEELIKQRKKIEARLIELDKEREIMEEDFENIKEGMAVASKVAMEEPLTEQDKEVLNEYKENYPDFIESDDENKSFSLLTRFKKLKSYFKSELKVNTENTDKLTQKRSDIMEQTTSLAAQASSSKTSNTPTSDYIDDLPDQSYNPLDDID